jgi:hypothetical protein
MSEGPLTPRRMRDFIDTLTEEQLDQPYVMHVDGGCAMPDAAGIGDGVIDLE